MHTFLFDLRINLCAMFRIGFVVPWLVSYWLSLCHVSYWLCCAMTCLVLAFFVPCFVSTCLFVPCFVLALLCHDLFRIGFLCAMFRIGFVVPWLVSYWLSLCHVSYWLCCAMTCFVLAFLCHVSYWLCCAMTCFILSCFLVVLSGLTSLPSLSMTYVFIVRGSWAVVNLDDDGALLHVPRPILYMDHPSILTGHPACLSLI